MRAAPPRLFVFGSILGAALAVAGPAGAEQSYQSQGLKAAIGDIGVSTTDKTKLTVQILLTNTTKFSQYVAISRSHANGSLSSGDVLALVQVTGLPDCPNDTKEGCVKYVSNPQYVEAGNTTSIVLTYFDQAGRSPGGAKFSFPLKMVAQTGAASDDIVAGGSEKPPGPPRSVVINFNQIPVP